MNFFFPNRVKLELGSIQSIGLVVRELGSRALFLVESGLEASKEFSMVAQVLKKESISFLCHIEKADPASHYLEEAVMLGFAGRCEVVIALGGENLLSFARWITVEILRRNPVTPKETAPSVCLVEIFTSVFFPLLLRREGFLSLGSPFELRFFDSTPTLTHFIFLDPQMSATLTSKTAATVLLGMLFFAIEAYFHEMSGLLEESLLLGAIKLLWKSVRNLESLIDVEQLVSYQAGFNISLALAMLPRSSGFSLAFVLAALGNLSTVVLGSLFLAPLLELYSPKDGSRLVKLAKNLDLDELDDSKEGLGLRLAQEVRKFLNTYQFPLRLADYHIPELLLTQAVGVVKSMSLPRGSLLEADKLFFFLEKIL